MRNIRFDSNGKPLKTKRNLAAALRNAADFLEENPDNHIEGYLYQKSDAGDCYCALGAVDKVCGVNPEDYPAKWKHFSLDFVGVQNVCAKVSKSFGGIRISGVKVNGKLIKSLYLINDRLVDANNKPAVISAMRKYARDLEHGAEM